MNASPHEIQPAGEVVVGEVIDDDVIELDALSGFLSKAAPWSAQPVRLQPRVTVFFWFLMSVDLAVSAWLFAVMRGELGCGGGLCTLATLHGHPLLTMCLTTASSLVLLATCAATHFFTRGTAPVLMLMSIAATVATASVLGAVVVVVLAGLLAAAVIATAFALLAALASR